MKEKNGFTEKTKKNNIEGKQRERKEKALPTNKHERENVLTEKTIFLMTKKFYE